MIYQDRLLGQIKIKDPIILDIINTKELQRLKGIDQAGYFDVYYPGTKYSRFEHSLGCYFLLKIFGASLEEQIAGLIHDASHSAFSHCVDYVLDEGSQIEQSHQDNIFRSYILASDILKILKKHNFDTDYILDEKNFPLQETSLPDLCADRIDYSLRGMMVYKLINKIKIKKFIDNLIIRDNKWVFKDFKIAENYAKLFQKLNKVYYTGIETAAMFQSVGACLKYALAAQYISKNDLYIDDEHVTKKIKKNLAQDEKLKKLWRRMNNQEKFENNPNNYDEIIYCKSRVVDPLVFDKNKVKRFSDIAPSWREIAAKESKPKKYFIRFF